jgi:hypothetical protein
MIATMLLMSVARAETPPSQIDDKWKDQQIDEHLASAKKTLKTACGSSAEIVIDKKSLSEASTRYVVENLKTELEIIEGFATERCTSADAKKEFAILKRFKIRGVPQSAQMEVTFANGAFDIPICSTGWKTSDTFVRALQTAKK